MAQGHRWEMRASPWRSGKWGAHVGVPRGCCRTQAHGKRAAWDCPAVGPGADVRSDRASRQAVSPPGAGGGPQSSPEMAESCCHRTGGPEALSSLSDKNQQSNIRVRNEE